MIAVVRAVSLPHFSAHKARTLFTVWGIALGVAAVAGMRLTPASVARS